VKGTRRVQPLLWLTSLLRSELGLLKTWPILLRTSGRVQQGRSQEYDLGV